MSAADTGAGSDGWQPLTRPPRRLNVDWDAAFPRLALCHLLSVSGETLVVLSLAGSFFFKVDPAQGREKVILGLLFTMAPFALVGPLIGPMIDRVKGGHRVVIQATMALRVVVAITMMIAVINDSLALFPEAFAMLVLAKTYQIAKAAVVPSTVAGDIELVEANSKLQLLSGLAAIVHWTLQVHRSLVVTTVVPPIDGPPPTWYFGVVIIASVAGGLVGAVLAPPLRRRLAEERILLGAGGLAILAGVAGVILDGLGGYSLMSLGIATAAALGKQAFDAVVQRDVEENDRGRIFARFEARFQITWVVGALVPSILHVPNAAGAILIALGGALATVVMATGVRPVLLNREVDGRRLGRPYLARNRSSDQ